VVTSGSEPVCELIRDLPVCPFFQLSPPKIQPICHLFRGLQNPQLLPPTTCSLFDSFALWILCASAPGISPCWSSVPPLSTLSSPNSGPFGVLSPAGHQRLELSWRRLVIWACGVGIRGVHRGHGVSVTQGLLRAYHQLCHVLQQVH
jgi:hypothetical protein